MGSVAKLRRKRRSPPDLVFGNIISEVACLSRMTRAGTRELINLFLATCRDTAWQRGRLVIPDFATIRIRDRKRRKVNHPTDPAIVYVVQQHRAVTIRATKNWRTLGGGR